MLHHETNDNLTGPVTDQDPRGWESATSVALDSITQPDCLLPSQYFGPRATAPVEGEMRLLIAVLRDAINLYARTRGRKAHREVEQFEEVNSWFEATGAPGLFAFENVCEVLGIDPGRLRRWLKSLHAAGAVAVPGPTAAGRLHSGCRGWRLNLGRPRRPRAPSLGRRTRGGAQRRPVEPADSFSDENQVASARRQRSMLKAEGVVELAAGEGDAQRALFDARQRLLA